MGNIGKITPSGAVAEYSASAGALAIPSGITAGPGGNIWFSETNEKLIGISTPAGVISFKPLTPGMASGGITQGPDGNVWFTEGSATASAIGRMTAAGTVTDFAISTPNSGPSTSS